MRQVACRHRAEVFLKLQASEISQPRDTSCNKIFSGQTLQLDGMEFTNAPFQGVTFTYCGGAYSFRNVTFSLPLTVRLEGPAANTAGVIDLIRSLNSGNGRLSPSTGVPIVRETGTRKTVRNV